MTAGAPNALAAAVACIDNVTDALSGTWRLKTLDGQPVPASAVPELPSGRHLYLRAARGRTGCGASGHGGLEYGVYRWNRTTHAFQIRTAVIDTNGECGLHDEDTFTGVLVGNPDGTLTFSDSEETFTLEPVPSNAGTLIGSWGDNQAFVVYESNGKFFLATTRAILQNTASSPGIEDGCTRCRAHRAPERSRST